MSSDRVGGLNCRMTRQRMAAARMNQNVLRPAVRTGPDLVDDGDRIDDECGGEGYPEQQQGVRQGHPRVQKGRQERFGVEQSAWPDQSRPQVPDGRDDGTGGHEQETGDGDQGGPSRRSRESGRESVSRNGHV